MRNLTKFAAAAAATIITCSAADATPIVAGQAGVVPSYIAPANITVLATYNNLAFTSQAPAGLTSTFSGTYTAAVFRDTTNTLCGTSGMCLTFGIQVNNNSTSADGIETVTTGPFSSLFTYNVGYNNSNGSLTPAGGRIPLYVADTSTGTLSFNFTSATNTSNMIMPGQSSSYLLIQTSAMNYQTGNISFQDNQTATVAGFIPAVGTAAPSVPEPASWLMMIGGFGLAGTAMRRRKLVAKLA